MALKRPFFQYFLGGTFITLFENVEFLFLVYLNFKIRSCWWEYNYALTTLEELIDKKLLKLTGEFIITKKNYLFWVVRKRNLGIYLLLFNIIKMCNSNIVWR